MAPQKRRRERGLSKRAPKSIAPVALDPLTPREGEVVKWIAAGKRNDEIAAIFNRSPRTVQKHVQNILDKLGVETRTAACTWWHEQCREAERVRNGNGR
jgi:DNA-binding CsgD family transcriptional regulator